MGRHEREHVAVVVPVAAGFLVGLDMTVANVRRIVLYEGGADPSPGRERRVFRRAYWRLWSAWMGWSA